jgi:hypothetical protein
MKRSLFIIVLIIAAGVWYYNSKNPSLSTAGAPWEEVSVGDFDSRVLKSPLPALVYFDAAEGCDGADVVFARLRQRWGNQLGVFHFKAESNPQFARTYGVDEHVVFALFRDGRMVKRIEAPTFLKPLLGPNNEVSSLEAFYDDFLAALERFANLR